MPTNLTSRYQSQTLMHDQSKGFMTTYHNLINIKKIHIPNHLYITHAPWGIWAFNHNETQLMSSSQCYELVKKLNV